MKAVVYTDFIQTIILVGTVVMIAIKGTYDVGGFSVIYERNQASGRFEGPK